MADPVAGRSWLEILNAAVETAKTTNAAPPTSTDKIHGQAEAFEPLFDEIKLKLKTDLKNLIEPTQPHGRK